MHRIIFHIKDKSILQHDYLGMYHFAVLQMSDGTFMVSTSVEEPGLFRYMLEVHVDFKNTVHILPTVRSQDPVHPETYQAVLTHSAKTKSHLVSGNKDTHSVLMALYQGHEETFFSPHYLS